MCASCAVRCAACAVLCIGVSTARGEAGTGDRQNKTGAAAVLSLFAVDVYIPVPFTGDYIISHS